MGLLDVLFPKKKDPEQAIMEYFQTMTAYRPSFTSFEGSIYEMELTRAVIHSFATHVSKLKPEVRGSGNQQLERRLQYRPNPFQDTTKYLYRLATIFMVKNNAFIAPIYDRTYESIVGFYPLLPDNVELKEYKGQVYVVYSFGGFKAAIEYERTGLLNQFQFKDDFFGTSNQALYPTMEILNTQSQGIVESIKNSATIRFMAQLANTLKDDDIRKEQKRFSETNLANTNDTGVLLFDQKYATVKQILSKPYLVDSQQMSNIKDSVFSYFGTNDNILQNKFTSDQWNAYYEGKIEPFALQMSLVHTNMTFSEREVSFGNYIMFTANRLQYLSNTEKLNTVVQLFDRGFLTHNQGLEIFNMTSIGEEGDKRYIRKEYAKTTNLDYELTHDEADAEEPQEQPPLFDLPTDEEVEA